jgi:hypothetical protein
VLYDEGCDCLTSKDVEEKGRDAKPQPKNRHKIGIDDIIWLVVD